MARTELRTHPKFKRLCRKLDLPAPYVMGLLEMMWHTGYQSGSDLLGGPIDVEAAAEWPGEPGLFFAAVQTEWVELRDDNLWYIHDFWQHAPQYVKRKADRMASHRLASGKPVASSTQHNPTQPNTYQEACASSTTPASPPIVANESPTVAATGGEQQAAGDDPALLTFPTCRGKSNGATSWALTQSLAAELGELFPALSVLDEARAALAWVKADRTRHKTAGGMRRFLTGWLTRAQNSGRRVAPASANLPARNGHSPATTGPRPARGAVKYAS